MDGKNFGRAMLAGLVATIIMSIVQAMAPMMGLPRMDIAAMVGSMLGGSLVVGWIVHLMMGTILWAAVYAYIVEPSLGGAPWVRGLTYGFLLAIFVLIIGFPVVGAMFPSFTPKPGFLGMGLGGAMGTMGVIIGHLVYGLVLGAIYGQPAAEHQSAVGAHAQRS
ncbi:MAG TPA: DUF6789 family protein [bacterium]|nr:DUF6789 family protein [bacterium]